MARYDRMNTLLQILSEREHLDVLEVAAELNVSAATIRRDLNALAKRQLLTRTRGGAVVNDLVFDLPLRYKTARRMPEKQRISVAAAALVEVGMVVGLNGGTTTAGVARALAVRSDLAARGDSPGLTVVTNALTIAHELAVRPNIKLVVTGGVARSQSFELSGPLASRVLGELTIGLLFLGVDAIDPAAGAFAAHEGEASTNRLMVERAQRVVAVADGSKLGHRAFAQICQTSRVHTLVTDAEAPSEVIRAFQAAGVAVQTV
jgi:DeoR family transcriptional regulator of aga operon